jgi:hypothetical protein
MRHTRWWLLAVSGVALYGALAFYQLGVAQSGIKPSIANSAEDRQAMVANLEEIKTLLKEQNALLKSGQVKVIVTELPKK